MLVAVRFAILTCLLLEPTLCRAEETRSRAHARGDEQEIRARYREAFEAVKARDWPKAQAVLLELWNQSNTYDVAALAGDVEEKLGNKASAAQYYAFVLDNLPPRETLGTVEEVRENLRRLKTEVATVRFEVYPKAASVRVDGQPIEFSELPPEVYVKPGRRTFAAVLGGQRAVERLQVVAGQEYRVVLRMPEAPAAAPPAESGGTEVKSSQWAVAPGDPGASGRSLVPVYVGAGVAAIGLGAWVGLGLDARSARSEAESYRRQLGPSDCQQGDAGEVCGEAQRSFDRQRQSALFGNIGMGVALTATAATAAYLLFWPEPKHERKGARFCPLLVGDRTGGAVGVSGAF